MRHIDQCQPLPGMLLVRPDRENARQGLSSLVDQGAPKLNGTGEVIAVGYQPPPFMPPTYTTPDGLVARPPVERPRQYLSVGDVIAYGRVNAQSIALINEIGEQEDFFLIHVDDVTCLFRDQAPLIA